MSELEFVCKHDGHDEEEIIGFCLNQKCQIEAQICLKCCWDKHTDHEDDCKTFKQISNLLKKNKKALPSQNDEVINKLKEIQTKSEKLCQSNNIGYEKLDEIEKYLQEKQYQNCQADVWVLKNFLNSQDQNNEKLILEELENILKALNNLGNPQVKEKYISQSSNTDNIQINQVEKRHQEIQVNIESQSTSEQAQSKSQIKQLKNKEDEIEITYEKQTYPKQPIQQSPFLQTDFQNSKEKSPQEISQQIGVNSSQILQNKVQQHSFQQNLKSQNPSLLFQQISSYQNQISNQPQAFKTSNPMIQTTQPHSILTSQIPQTPQIIKQPTQPLLQLENTRPIIQQQNVNQSQFQQPIQQQGTCPQSEKDIKTKLQSVNQQYMNQNPEYQNQPLPEINLSYLQQKNSQKIFSEDDLVLLLNSQEIAFKNEELQQVLNSCDEALQTDPFKYEFNFKKCLTLLKMQKYNDAFFYCETMQQISPINKTFTLKGIALHGLKDYIEALNSYCISISTQPTFEIYLFQGKTLMAMKEHDVAIQSFENSIKMEPQQHYGYYYKGLALIEQKKFNLAMTNFDIALKFSPKNVQALIQKAKCLNKLQAFKEAIKCADKAIQFKPDEESAYFQRGFGLFKLEDYQQALKQFENVIQIQNQMNEAHFYKGQILHHLGKFQEAIKAFDEALRIEENPYYMIKKADTLKAMENIEEADLLYQKAQSIISNGIWENLNIEQN
ncbi:unnamed protein product [Paramecium sonneborni]|uniref:Tetratricopeptide repeat protein n=1 Tax=Paramecium sonneborni TaxID=65129 RepID=A0A8S1NTY8_9CILI|nr:unnamed protein product [Paramecium sonneborni]CAD8096168.1 unnamed protein product [Paramecium sonneborni]